MGDMQSPARSVPADMLIERENVWALSSHMVITGGKMPYYVKVKTWTMRPQLTLFVGTTQTGAPVAASRPKKGQNAVLCLGDPESRQADWIDLEHGASRYNGKFSMPIHLEGRCFTCEKSKDKNLGFGTWRHGWVVWCLSGVEPVCVLRPSGSSGKKKATIQWSEPVTAQEEAIVVLTMCHLFYKFNSENSESAVIL